MNFESASRLCINISGLLITKILSIPWIEVNRIMTAFRIIGKSCLNRICLAI